MCINLDPKETRFIKRSPGHLRLRFIKRSLRHLAVLNLILCGGYRVGNKELSNLLVCLQIED